MAFPPCKTFQVKPWTQVEGLWSFFKLLKGKLAQLFSGKFEEKTDCVLGKSEMNSIFLFLMILIEIVFLAQDSHSFG